jgi:hypothetical protein
MPETNPNAERTARDGEMYCDGSLAGFNCDRPTGHGGDHIAHMASGTVLHRWPAAATAGKANETNPNAAEWTEYEVHGRSLVTASLGATDITVFSPRDPFDSHSVQIVRHVRDIASRAEGQRIALDLAARLAVDGPALAAENAALRERLAAALVHVREVLGSEATMPPEAIGRLCVAERALAAQPPAAAPMRPSDLWTGADRHSPGCECDSADDLDPTCKAAQPPAAVTEAPGDSEHMAPLESDDCNAEEVGGRFEFGCTRPRGHGGTHHVAHVSPSEVVHRWPIVRGTP